MSRAHYDELLRRVEEQHARYLRSLRDLHDTLASQTPEDRGVGAPTPPLKPLSVTSTFTSELSPFSAEGGRRPRRLTNELGDRRALLLKNTPASLLSIDLESSDDEDFHHLPPLQLTAGSSTGDKNCVQEPLKGYALHDSDLYYYLKDFEFTEQTQIALDDVYRRREELEFHSMFWLFDDQHNKVYDSAAYQVYDIGKNGLAEPKHSADDNDADSILDARTVWDTVKV